MIPIFQDFFEDDFVGFENNDSCLLYIAGYKTFKMKHKYNHCQQCVNFCLEIAAVDGASDDP